MNITTLAHVCLKTSDLQRTHDFYSVALGLKHHFNFTRNGKVIGFYLVAGKRSYIEVFESDAIEPIGKQPIHHLCLEADDLQLLHTRLTTLGLNPGAMKLAADHTWQFWITDPNGLAIEIQQYTDKSAQLTARDVEVDW